MTYIHKKCYCERLGDDSASKVLGAQVQVLSSSPRTRVKSCSCNPSAGEVKTGRFLGFRGPASSAG